MFCMMRLSGLPAMPGLPALSNLMPSPITLTLAAIVPSLANPPHAIRMCPPLTVKNWADFQPLVGYYTVQCGVVHLC